jgi:iron complex outermembrane receptor protein
LGGGSRRAAAEDGVTADSGGLADIVVTAQRRSESLQKVPVVVTAVEPEVLEARNVSTLQDLPKLTPSLTVQNQASNVTPFIRGVGSTVTGAGQAASVATYVDGVYIATLTSAAFDLDNVEQVQVLEGPQGALYGRNATGGAIVVTTKTPRPGDPISGRFRAGYGNYNNREASGIVSGGLGEMFAFSVNGSIRKRDGYIKNLNAPGAGTSNADFYDRDSKSIGAVLVFKPSEQFNLVLRAQHFDPTIGRAGLSGGRARPQRAGYGPQRIAALLCRLSAELRRFARRRVRRGGEFALQR